MRSIRYMAGGKPHNLDDCIDYSDGVKEAGQATVLVSLYAQEDATEMWVLNRLYGRFEWTFPNGKAARYITGFGGCFSHESVERQMLSVDNANYRLNDIYERLKFRKVEVKGKSLEGKLTDNLPKFGYSVIYNYTVKSGGIGCIKEIKGSTHQNKKEKGKEGGKNDS